MKDEKIIALCRIAHRTYFDNEQMRDGCRIGRFDDLTPEQKQAWFCSIEAVVKAVQREDRKEFFIGLAFGILIWTLFRELIIGAL